MMLNFVELCLQDFLLIIIPNVCLINLIVHISHLFIYLLIIGFIYRSHMLTPRNGRQVHEFGA